MCAGASGNPVGHNAMSMRELMLLFQQKEEIDEQLKEAEKQQFLLEEG